MLRRSSWLGTVVVAITGLTLSVGVLASLPAVASAHSASGRIAVRCDTERYSRNAAQHRSRQTKASACESPSIYRVSFRGGPADPEIIIHGRNFGRRPKADPPGGTSNLGQCGSISGNTGNDYGTKLWLDDHTQLWSAGYLPYVDCMGIIVVKYSDREIAYRLGSFYSIHYKQRNAFSHGIYKLAEGDSVTITVKGAVVTMRVDYEPRRDKHRRRSSAR